eukprot:m.121682 g.121682  ORF g.121682 m.121682 type:complete len:265 (-) comp14584_c0_seq1:2781-3575(-)
MSDNLEDELSILQAIYPEQIQGTERGFVFENNEPQFSLEFFFAPGHSAPQICVHSKILSRSKVEILQRELVAFQRQLPADEPMGFRIITWIVENVATLLQDGSETTGNEEARITSTTHTTTTASSPALELAHCSVDHIRSLRTYRAALEAICASNGLTCHVLLHTAHPIIIFVGAPDAVSAALRDMRTRNVDVNTRGQPCKERLLHVHERRAIPTSVVEAMTGTAARGDEHALLTHTCLVHQEGPPPPLLSLFTTLGMDIAARR